MFPYLILCFSNITKSKTKTFWDFMRVPRELSGVGGLVPQEKKTTFLNSYIEITKMKCSS